MMRSLLFPVGATSVFLVAALIMVIAHSGVKSQRQSNKSNRKNLVSHIDYIANHIDQYRYLENNYSNFEQLISQSDKSARRKLTLVNRLEAVRTELEIPDMSFEISPFRPLSSVEHQPIIGYEEVVLELGVLHDTQLLKFFSFLDSTPGMFETTAVRIERIEHRDDAKDSLLVNLQVDFLIRWYTFNSEADDVGTI